jgi:hypothetical protein
MSGATALITALSALLVAASALTPVLILLLKEIRKVHTIVNQQRTDMTAYQLKLTESLRSHGIEIPTDDSIPSA